MWKWIVGGVALLAVALFATCYIAYRRLANGGDTTETVIAAPPARVFAALADADSIAVWMGSTATVVATHHGPLVVGDTVHIEEHTASGRSQKSLTWTVSEIVPARLLAMRLQDSSGRVAASERDSLVASGDSTLIISVIGSPMLDSIRSTRSDTGGRIAGAALSMTNKLLIGAFRTIAADHQRKLKQHLEGKPGS